MPGSMYGFSSERLLDRDEVRQRLRRMNDNELRRWGAAARYMCSPSLVSRPDRILSSSSKKRSPSGAGRHGAGPARL
jgi:hypothetical protein